VLGQGEAIKEFQNRFPLLFAILCGMVFLLALRLAYLQIYRGSFYYRFSQVNSLRKEKLPGPRGQIFDRDGQLLVDNRLQLDVTVTPQFARNANEVLTRLAEIVGTPADRLIQTYREKVRGAPKFQPITVLQNVPWEVVVRIESSKTLLSGVDVESRIRRTYLQGGVGAHVLGYLSEVTKRDLENSKQLGSSYSVGDWIGRFGLERKWESYLRGEDGVRFVVVDAHGHRLKEGTGADMALIQSLEQNLEPKPGFNLVLTLDAELQAAAAEAMKGKLGGVVALDPRTGEILAMISQPSFDPTEMALKGPELWTSFVKNPYGPLRNKVVQDHYPSGSTFKVFSALAALEAGIIDQNTTVNCPGFYRFGNRIYSCHKKEGHGPVSLERAISGSCDVYFYHVAARLGIDPISKMASYFGLGRKTGVDLFHEVPGLMPTEAWKEATYKEPWNPGETLSAAIGQSYNLVTPLQLAVAYSTLINGGNLYRPYVLSRIDTLEGEVAQRTSPELLSNHKINPQHLEAVKTGLHSVVNAPNGTGFLTVRSKNVEISGKSGTVQVFNYANREEAFRLKCETLPFEKRNHAWFVGYAPRETPEIVVAVFGMHQCAGSRESGPVVRAVIEKWWEKTHGRNMGPQPASARARSDGRGLAPTKPIQEQKPLFAR
jgi:penicillin-binding protein 2